MITTTQKSLLIICYALYLDLPLSGVNFQCMQRNWNVSCYAFAMPLKAGRLVKMLSASSLPSPKILSSFLRALSQPC